MTQKIMFSSRVFGNDVDKTLEYAGTKGFGGVEWYLNSFRLRTNRGMREEFFAKLDEHPGLYYTFHLPTTDVELAHKESLIATSSLYYLKMNLEYLASWLIKQDHESVITLHVGSNSIPTKDLDWDTALANLNKLDRFAKARNAQVLLENLKVGWTTDPEKHLALINGTDLGITFDTGHAASNPSVLSGQLDLVEYLARLQEKVLHVHFYAYEDLKTGGHVPPKRWEDIDAVWSKVITLPRKPAIVLELSTRHELEQTYNILLENKANW